MGSGLAGVGHDATWQLREVYAQEPAAGRGGGGEHLAVGVGVVLRLEKTPRRKVFSG